MYDGKQYCSFEFQDADTVLESTWEKDYFDPDAASFVSSRTVTLEEAVGIWARAADTRDGGYELYKQYFDYSDRYGGEAAGRFRTLAEQAGAEIDRSVKDIR